MSVVAVIVLLVALAGLAEECALLILYRRYSPPETPTAPPFVSVLVAMRNEEKNVTRCLNALLAQEYAGEYEILVGDDGSVDHTLTLLREMAELHPTITVLEINEELGKAHGKANVLAHLARHASGDLFLLTDADTAVGTTWVKYMSEGWYDGLGLVNGLTELEGSALQHLEWIHGQGLLHVMHQRTPLTGIGNNMAVSREAYMSCGGYENIPFSLTEDRALAQALVQQGFTIQSRLCSGTLSSSQSIPSISDFFQQRRRWMSGAVQLNFWVVVLLAIRAAYYPAVLYVLATKPVLGAGIILVKIVLQDTFVQRIHALCTVQSTLLARIFFEPYLGTMSWIHIFLHLWPGEVRWKGREFKSR